MAQTFATEPTTASAHERAGGWLSYVATWLDPTKRRALAALTIRVGGAGLAYVMQILLAQWMGLTEYGIFVGVWVWLLVLGGVAPLGLNIQVIGQIATLHDAGDLRAWRGLMVTSLAITIGVGCLFAASGWALLFAMPELVAPAYLMPIGVVLLCVPLIALTEVTEGIARAHGWMTSALAPTYLLRPVLLIGGCYGWLQAGHSLNATAALAIAMAACLVTLSVQASAIAVRVIRIGGWGGIQTSAGPWLLAALPIVLTQTFELMTQNFDLIAVSYFLGAGSTAVYFAALKTIALLAFINFAVGAATANHVASLHAARKQAELATHVRGAINLAFWPTLAGAVVLVAVAPTLLSLFGEGFADNAHLTAILAIGFVAKGLVGPAELYLNVVGQQRACAVVLLVAALTNLVLNIVLIPLFGLEGAAAATAIAMIVLSGGLHRLARHRLGLVLRPSIDWLMPTVDGGLVADSKAARS